ncbi:MAG: hypothetical protein O2829_04440 [Bacteroidetes bacterium]|nr:hypothetical protein [Bacteroidota bacterium]MDA1268322.1 hypothetical protein [Bacteroidota bacterium]
MLKKLCLFLFLLTITGGWVCAQFVKEYRVPEKVGIEKVSLNFSSYKSETQVKRSAGLDPLRIHGHLLQANILPDFWSSTSKNQLVASLVHKNIESDNLGKSITSKLFSTSTGFDHSWDVGLTSNYAYALDFNLGLGTADFDLAQLAVSTLKIKSASADIFIHYSVDTPNLVGMDTLMVILNMGAVDLHQAQLTQAKKVIIEVNYGQINLNYGQSQSFKGQVIAAVGGGIIYLKLPPESSPIKIRMKTTPLCRTSLPDYLRAIGEDTFITKGFAASDPRLLEFILEVGVGAITIE